jgi:hypothetical protein
LSNIDKQVRILGEALAAVHHRYRNSTASRANPLTLWERKTVDGHRRYVPMWDSGQLAVGPAAGN